MARTGTLNVLDTNDQETVHQSILHAAPDLASGLEAIRGLYLHVPFCFHKCHYCDFYSIVETRGRQDAFVNRLIAELRWAGELIDTPIETIFVGGGTPTLLSGHAWREILAILNESFTLHDDLEFTIEANPETVTSELAASLVSGGVNRVNIGAQSFHPHLLRQLERHHEPENVARSVVIFRNAGINNINLDLIFGIPTQRLTEWEADLDKALSLDPSHLSCYSLMYEPGTPLTVKLNTGRIERIDEDIEAAMFEHVVDRLDSTGYEHYEISNWSRPGLRCRHNLLYWTNANWWPIGPSASGHMHGLRWKNVPRLGTYLESPDAPPVTGVERLDASARLGEELMLCLRLLDGALLDEILSDGDPRWSIIHDFERTGLLITERGRTKLTRAGLMLADSIFVALL